MPGEHSPSHYVQPLARVVLMGDPNAVHIAQSTNVGILHKHEVFSDVEFLTRHAPFPRGPVASGWAAGDPSVQASDVCVGVYIDDTGVLGVVPWASFNKENVCTKLGSKIDAAYNFKDVPIT